MTSLFPALLDYSIIATLLLRFVAGTLFLTFGLKLFSALHGTKSALTVKTFLGYGIAVIKTTTGLFLIIGLFTQVGALLGTLISSYFLFENIRTKASASAIQTQILLLTISLSLLFLGSGYLAIDIPL